MGVVQKFAVLALRPSAHWSPAASADGTQDIASILSIYFADHGRRLTRSILKSIVFSLQALEIALAGRPWWERIGAALPRAEDQPLRQQLQAFLETSSLFDFADLTDEFRQLCRAEIGARLYSGLLTEGFLDPQEIAEKVSLLADHANAGRLAEAEREWIAQLATDMKEANLPTVGQLLEFSAEHAGADLVAVVRTIFHREAESDEELAREPAFVAKDEQEASLSDLYDLMEHNGSRLRILLAENRTLAKHVEDHGPFAPHDFLGLAHAIAQSLHSAHENGAAHLRPAPVDVLFRHDGSDWHVEILGFGAAPETVFPVRTAADLVDRFYYAAPELRGLEEDVEPGVHSDVYSYAKICCFALFGTPEPDDEEKEKLPASWRRMLGLCLRRKVEHRLTDFTAVLDQLAHIEMETLEHPGETVAEDELDVEEVPESEIYSVEGVGEGGAIDALKYNDRGMECAGRGEYDEAVEQFTMALRLDPAMAMAYYNRGDAHRLKGELDRANADFTEALRLDPDYVMAYVNQGRTLRLQGKHDAAIAAFSKAVEVDPGEADAFNNRGNVHADKGEFDLAIADYVKALELDPKLAPAYINRALAYAKMGDFDLVVNDCNAALRLNPKLTSAYFIRGVAYSNKRAFDNAIADFSTVLRLDPNYAVAYNDRGLAYSAKGDYDRAIADYIQALRLDPKLLLAYMNLSIAHRLKGAYDLAITGFTKLLRLQPKNPPAHYNRGLCFAAKEDLEKAMADFNATIRLDPGHAEALAKRTEILKSYREKKKAAEQANLQHAAAERDEAELRQSKAAIFVARAQMHYDNERYDRAVAEFTEAIKVDPKDSTTFYKRGLAYVAREDTEKAVADYTEAVKLSPEFTAAYFHRGVAFRLMGNFPRAVDDFTSVIELDPTYALAFRNRGLAQAAMGEQTLAKADYEEAIRLDPNLAKK